MFRAGLATGRWHRLPFVQQLTNLRHFQVSAALPEHSFQVDVDDFSKPSKVRLDAYLAAKLPETSRARLQASIKGGLITVNGSKQSKASYIVKQGDVVLCSVLPPPPLEASPESIPLDIVFEDEHVIIVNKTADMVMHPAPGNYSGTMVNALLYHCGLPSVKLAVADDATDAGRSSSASIADSISSDTDGLQIIDSEMGDEDEDEDDVGGFELLLGDQQLPGQKVAGTFSSSSSGLSSVGSNTHVIRPGIVHRLDKGTTGLVVVAKTDLAHVSLCGQFKDRSVGRTYYALTLGVPHPSKGRVETNIGRDFRDRKKMAAFEFCSTRGRNAASNYTLIETLAGGRAALVEWRLETGRTHQIRVHSKYIGNPLIADDTYSGGTGAAVSVLGGGKAQRVAATHAVIKVLERPALHAKTLEFDHPVTGERMQFDSELPEDFKEALDMLRNPTQF